MTRVLFDHLSKRVDDAMLLHEFSLEVHHNEFLVLVGPYGCGHSMVLQMVAGLEEPTKGRIVFDDLEASDLALQDRGIAIVSELNPRVTVQQNLASGLACQHPSRAQAEQRVRAVAAALEIEELLKLKPKELTGGQYLRVALGRAVISNPRIIVMNQPLASFCGQLKDQMRLELARFHHKWPTTVLMATHDATEAMALADRNVVMRDGCVHQVDTPQKIYQRPVDLFVAGYMGNPKMNFLQVTLIQEEGLLYLTQEGTFAIPVPLSMREQLQFYVGREVIFGIRPEDLEDAIFAKQLSPTPILHAKVEIVEHLGAETILHLSAGSTPLTARVHPGSCIGVGQQIDLVLDMEKAHLFDKQTEKRIV